MSNLIRTNEDGSPVVSIRKIRGRTVLMAHIRKGDQWVELPAEKIIAMINKTAAKPAAPAQTDSKAATAKALLDITMRYRTGGVR